MSERMWLSEELEKARTERDVLLVEVDRLRRREALLRITPTWMLKAAERHCEWLAFKHALNAAFNAMDDRDSAPQSVHGACENEKR
jgi:hypothetical protein